MTALGVVIVAAALLAAYYVRTRVWPRYVLFVGKDALDAALLDAWQSGYASGAQQGGVRWILEATDEAPLQ